MGLVTVLLAAQAPAKRAAKVSPMAAVSGNSETLPATRHTTRLLFGKVEWTLGVHHATSSVDPENEDELQRAIEALTHDKTIIMIAHRLKTVRNADQILVLDNAHIVQRGTHAELIQQKGLYADFVSARQEAIGWKLAQ